MGQEQLWFLEQMAPGLATYNVAVAHRIRGPLDSEALRTALTELVRRHELLRGTVATIDGTPGVRIQLDIAGSGSHGPVVKSCSSTSRASLPCLVAVDR
ncbi:condensation domain-containing protein [Micromonospora craniellae]|uniref:condensation domain-containing protein n=1 Tax=Micromonospora craniellae TaxID=2294034 RepID=UPI00168BB2B1|nr:hypothetical protein ID554_05775 [Micromonospora craniellae]